MRERRKIYENDPAQILQLLKEGNASANVFANATLAKVKKAIKTDFN